MKRFKINVFTDFGYVIVYIGSLSDIKNTIPKLTGRSKKWVEKDLDGGGITYNISEEPYPVIVINTDYKRVSFIITLAHEAVHAMDYMMKNLGINSKESEFRAYGVAYILDTIKKKYKL